MVQMLGWFRAEAAWARAESGQSCRVFGYRIRQKLKGNKSVKTDIFGLVNDAHAAAA